MGFVGALVAALLIAACYSPAAEDCSYTCNAGACPTGLYCVNRICRSDPDRTGPCAGPGFDGALDGTMSRYADAVLLDDPIAYFRLGELSGTTASNEVASAGDGMYIASPELGVMGALSDTSTAVRLEPVNGMQCVTVATSAATYQVAAGESYTLEAWINMETYSTAALPREIVGRLGIQSADIGYSLGLQFDNSPGKSRLRLRVGNGTTADTAISTSFLDLARWYHVAVTFDGASNMAQFYVDGISAGVDSPTVAPGVLADVAFTIGCQDETAALRGLFDGVIDEVAFYRRVLPPERVMAHFMNR